MATILSRPQCVNDSNDAISTIFPAGVWRVDGVFVHRRGIQAMDAVLGYTSWLSQPHFLYASPELPHRFNMSPLERLHASSVSDAKNYSKIFNIRRAKSIKINRFSSRLAIVFAQCIQTKC